MSDNIRGIFLMTLAMVCFSIGDATIKVLSATYDRPVFMVVAGVGLVVTFLLFPRKPDERVLDRRALQGAPLIRSLAEIVAATTMIFALGHVPFTILTLVMQSIPLVVALGTVVFFREPIGPRRWIAIIVGFIGVVVVLRPGGAVFSPEWLYALVAAVALATRDLCSRAVPKSISTVQISLWGGFAVLLAGIVFQASSGTGVPAIHWVHVPGFVVIVLFWSGGIFAITEAMRSGEVGVVAPFRYMRLPIGMLIGWIYFGEIIDGPMIIGAGIIVASGLYVLFRENSTMAGR